MSVKMQIDKDGNLVFQDTKVKLGELIRYNGENLVDGYNNVVDIANLLGDIFNNEDTQIVERALLADDTLKVGGTLAADVLTKLNYRETIPVTELPVISIGDGVTEGDTLTGVIENYSDKNVYLTTATIGEVNIDTNGNISYVTPDVDSDTEVTITVVSIEQGTIRSDTYTKTFTIYVVEDTGDGSTTSDQTLLNPDYNANEDYNDGFEY